MNKKEIRTKILGLKDNIEEEDLKNYNELIFNSLKDNEIYQNAKNIMIYLNFGKEVNTKAIIDYSLSIGKNISVPITYKSEGVIKASAIDDLSQLELGYYNILTPKEEFINIVDKKDLDLIIVPGVAFDKSGYRIGYGGGYYDKFLQNLNNTPKIALLFSLQLVDDLPQCDYDIPVDYLISEKETINCKFF